MMRFNLHWIHHSYNVLLHDMEVTGMAEIIVITPGSFRFVELQI